MNLFLILLFQTFLLFNQPQLGDCELKLVAEFFRHGARQVIFDYWNADIFPDWGALTTVGMRQHYVLGQTLRKRYIEDLQFLSPNFNSTEMYLQSTDVNRTLRSALSQLYGFYPVEFGPYLPVDLPPNILLPPWSNITANDKQQETLPSLFQPFPLHTQLNQYNYLLKAYDPTTCAVNTQLQQQQIQSADYQRILSVIESNLLKVAKYINYTSKTINFAQAYEIMDVFQDDIFWNKPLPAGLSEAEQPQLWKDLTFAYNLYMYIEMYASETQKKLVATPFFDEMQAIFEQSLNNLSAVKWRMYSAHDTTVSNYWNVGISIKPYKLPMHV